MATRIVQVAKNFKWSLRPCSVNSTATSLTKCIVIPLRNRVTTDTGAFLPQPKKTPFGLIRVLLTVLPGLYLGATISKEGAAFLEENDIFVPDEDDDDE